MATMQQRQHRAKEYLESQGFHVASTTGSYIQMQYGRLDILSVYLCNDGNILVQLDWGVFRDYHISYGETAIPVDEHHTIPDRIRTIANHAVILLSLVEWSPIRADENSYLRLPDGHIPVDALDHPIEYRDDDLLLKFTLSKRVERAWPVMGFRYIFEPFGELSFTQNLRPGQLVVFPSDIRRMQDDILHWCALPDNPFRKFRSDCIFQFTK